MYYTNFSESITAKWRVVCEGWPLKKFCSPADLSTRNEVELLSNSWKNGTTKFRRLSDEEFQNWEQERFEVAVNEMTGEDDYTGDGDGDVDLGSDDNRSQESEPHDGAPSSSHNGRVSARQPTEALSNSATPLSSTLPTAIEALLSPATPLSSTWPIGSKRPSPTSNDPAMSKRHKPSPLGSSTVVNTLTSVGGKPIVTVKMTRKERSDKGKKWGPRRKSTTASAAPSD
jgi:hypothetical protein